MNRRTLLAAALAAPIAGAIAAPGVAAANRRRLPSIINLPTGWCPDGIAVDGDKAFVSSLADGAIFCADLRTGAGKTAVPGVTGTQTTGLEIDRRHRIWAGCGLMGGAAVFDQITGQCLATYDFRGGYINDNTIRRSAVFFTDSERPKIYCVEFGPHGALPGPGGWQALSLPRGLGDTGAFNNGIATAWNGCLIVVQSRADRLYAFDPVTREAHRISTGGASVAEADGLLLRGRSLYVACTRQDTIAKFRLNDGLTRATLVDRIKDRDLDGPSTIAAFADHLFAVNARPTTPPTPTTTYCLVRVHD